MEITEKQIELKSISEVASLIANHSFLDFKLDIGSTRPTWDGDIYLHKDNTKRNICAIRVQIKGRSVREFSKIAKCTIDVADLNNYKNNEGIILFLAEIDFSKDDVRIFHRALTRNDLHHISSTTMTSQKTKTLVFTEYFSPSHPAIFEICDAFWKRKENEKIVGSGSSSQNKNLDIIAIDGAIGIFLEKNLSFYLKFCIILTSFNILGGTCGKFSPFSQCCISLIVAVIYAYFSKYICDETRWESFRFSIFALSMIPFYAYMSANLLSIYGVNDYASLGYPSLAGMIIAGIVPVEF